MSAPLSQPLTPILNTGSSETQIEGVKLEEQTRSIVPEWMAKDEKPSTEVTTIYKNLSETHSFEGANNIPDITETIKPKPPTPKKPIKTSFNRVPPDSDTKHQLYDQKEEVILEGFSKEDSLKEQITSTV